MHKCILCIESLLDNITAVIPTVQFHIVSRYVDVTFKGIDASLNVYVWMMSIIRGTGKSHETSLVGL